MPTKKVFSPPTNPPPVMTPSEVTRRFGNRKADWNHIFVSVLGAGLAAVGAVGHYLKPEGHSDLVTLGLVVIGCTLIHPTAIRDLVRSWKGTGA